MLILSAVVFNIFSQPKSSIFSAKCLILIKLFTRSNLLSYFEDIKNSFLLMFATLCDSIKQKNRVCVLSHIGKPCNFKKELLAPRETLIKTGWANFHCPGWVVSCWCVFVCTSAVVTAYLK